MKIGDWLPNTRYSILNWISYLSNNNFGHYIYKNQFINVLIIRVGKGTNIVIKKNTQKYVQN